MPRRPGVVVAPSRAPAPSAFGPARDFPPRSGAGRPRLPVRQAPLREWPAGTGPGRLSRRGTHRTRSTFRLAIACPGAHRHRHRAVACGRAGRALTRRRPWHTESPAGRHRGRVPDLEGGALTAACRGARDDRAPQARRGAGVAGDRERVRAGVPARCHASALGPGPCLWRRGGSRPREGVFGCAPNRCGRSADQAQQADDADALAAGTGAAHETAEAIFSCGDWGHGTTLPWVWRPSGKAAPALPSAESPALLAVRAGAAASAPRGMAAGPPLAVMPVGMVARGGGHTNQDTLEPPTRGPGQRDRTCEPVRPPWRGTRMLGTELGLPSTGVGHGPAGRAPAPRGAPARDAHGFASRPRFRAVRAGAGMTCGGDASAADDGR